MAARLVKVGAEWLIGLGRRWSAGRREEEGAAKRSSSWPSTRQLEAKVNCRRNYLLMIRIAKAQTR